MSTNKIDSLDAVATYIEALVTRLESLESQVAFQEDTIEQLNDEITTLNLNQALTKRQLELLAQKIKQEKGSAVADISEETPPPHY